MEESDTSTKGSSQPLAEMGDWLVQAGWQATQEKAHRPTAHPG